MSKDSATCLTSKPDIPGDDAAPTTKVALWVLASFDSDNRFKLFGNMSVLGLFLVILFTGLWVLMAAIFNLITDLVGGVRVTVLEEEVRTSNDPVVEAGESGQ